ncbi:Potassium channel, voltage-dependent, beta subunit, KCNAB-related protein [Beauveria brongniartii RCEF 3172]|uniref:Potassium channel, voltage-dependent, beta subunit, KCNAB-related protein n=1 Tax=Beauveria brongniartii RCEF 3172 TaxID=1081107 RepID=A0A166Y6F2_9HYPO|nr:Potassium channel, voltage-dependent, beta subunit, KCNAB-related protein [Beauveria brongniartii RCEF 3172]
MLEREKVESEFTLLYREPGLGLTVFSPLRLGILTGKYQNGIPDDSRLAQAGGKFTTAFWSHHSEMEWDAIITVVGKLQPIAKRLGIKMATLALAWVLENPNVSSEVTGASSLAQVYDNVRAIGAVEKLTPDIMAEIDRVLDNKPPTILERLPAGQK